MAEPEKSAQDLGAMITAARLLREKYLQDPHRPGYHFVVPEGLHGPVDPNGALFWKGRYHLCYIYQHENKHYWGHISSTDLLHWRHHLPALAPGGADDGIFSGGASIDKNGAAVIAYWGLGNPCGICLASSTDENLDHWTKNPHNPVIRETLCGLTVVPAADGKGAVIYGAADPSAVWVHNGRYYMLTGNLLVLEAFGKKANRPEHMGDTLYLFVSDDLNRWTYLHKFYESRREWTRDFEDDMCPDFFPLPSGPGGAKPSDKHMILFISHTLGCQYYIGEYANDRFIPQQHGRMTWVDNEYFAPESLLDDRGRRIMWAWVFDRRSEAARKASGWSGELSLPRELWLGEDGTLRMRPVEELARLRYNARNWRNLTVTKEAEVPLSGFCSNSFDLEVQIAPDTASQFGLKVSRSDGSEEETLV